MEIKQTIFGTVRKTAPISVGALVFGSAMQVGGFKTPALAAVLKAECFRNFVFKKLFGNPSLLMT